MLCSFPEPFPRHALWLQTNLTTGEFHQTYSHPSSYRSLEIALPRLECHSLVFVDLKNNTVILISKMSRGQRGYNMTVILNTVRVEAHGDPGRRKRNRMTLARGPAGPYLLSAKKEPGLPHSGPSAKAPSVLHTLLSSVIRPTPAGLCLPTFFVSSS